MGIGLLIAFLCTAMVAYHVPTRAWDASDHSPFFSQGIVYTGAFLGWGEYEDNVTIDALEAFEDLCQRHLALVPFSVFWGQGLARLSEDLNVVSRYGAVPIVRLMPWGPPYWEEPGYQRAYALSRIVRGDFDGFLMKMANIIRMFQGHVIVTFGVEMNGDWFPWSGVFQGGGKTSEYGDPSVADGPEVFKDAYRHIIELFRASGASNVLWMFHVNNESYPDEEWNLPREYYPGDDFIDLIGVSIYGKQYEDEPWTGFKALASASMDEIRAISETRPYIIAEWGVGEWPPYDKAQWYREALSAILEDFPFFRAAIVYSERWENDDGTFSDLRIDSSNEALEAFRTGISDRRFCGMACAFMGGRDIVPKLYVNGARDVYHEINGTQTVRLSLSLDVEENGGNGSADWWVYAQTPFGTYSLLLDQGLKWNAGLHAIYGGMVTPIPMVQFLEVSGLPEGIYDFYFSLDLTGDFTLNGPLYCSMVRVQVK